MDAIDFNEPTPEQKAEIKRRKGAITRQIKKEVLEKYGIDRLPIQAERALVTGGQGTGKSHTAAQAIAELKGTTAMWWLVPTLEKAQEQADEYTGMRTADSMKARVVRGRGAPDPRTDGATAMCPRHAVVNRAAAMGCDVHKEICNNGCPLRYECGFQRQNTSLRMDPTGLFVMAADYLWLPCPAPRPDVVIADESVIGKATDVASFDPARIMDDQKWSSPDLDEAMYLRETALLVRAAVTEHPGSELAFLRSKEVTDRALKDCVDHLHAREEAKPEVSGSMTDKQIAGILDMVEAREILKVHKLFRQIRREFNQPRDQLNSVWFEPEARVMVGGELERMPRVFVAHVRTPRFRKTTPVLALDGTGSLELNQRIFGEHMTGERFAVPRDAEVWQVTSKTFSRQSITGRNRDGSERTPQNMHEAAQLRAQVIDFLNMLPGDVLLVSYKAVIEGMIDDLPPHVTTAHFGGLRGLNSFEHCTTAVIMGREQPSAQTIEGLARPFTADDPEPFRPTGEYVLQPRGRRMRDPDAPNVVDVQVHADTRCQAFLEQVREAEMVQAVDRVRPVFNHRKIIVLNNLPLDLTVDHAMTWAEIRPGKFAHALARHGVLPLSKKDLAGCFPDLWRTEAAADKDLERVRAKTSKSNGLGQKKTTDKSQINILFGGCRLFFGEFLKATYRRKGQRGPLADALVRADLSDPRSVLEGMVGELTEFTVETPPKPPAQAKPHKPLAELPPLAAALSAEGHLLASMSPDARPMDTLGAQRVLMLMSYQAPEVRQAA